VPLISFEKITTARDRIKRYTVITPLRKSRYLSDLVDGDVYLKLENEQVTGSFKARGAFNRLFTLSPDELAAGIITASTGNHGLGVSLAARELGIKATVVYPINASHEKLEKMTEAGADVIQAVGFEEVEPYARNLAKEKGMIYVSPYNDPEIVAGAGTTGLEIIEQIDDIDIVIIPVGGGGLISGIALAIKTKAPHTMIIGVQSEASPEVYESWKAGHWVEAHESDSIAQGLMGGVESDSITLDIIREYVDKMILVSESSILDAMKILYEKERLKVEGAGAVSFAAFIKCATDFKGKRVVIVVSGGNIGEEEFRSLLSRSSPS